MRGETAGYPTVPSHLTSRPVSMRLSGRDGAPPHLGVGGLGTGHRARRWSDWKPHDCVCRRQGRERGPPETTAWSVKKEGSVRSLSLPQRARDSRDGCARGRSMCLRSLPGPSGADTNGFSLREEAPVGVAATEPRLPGAGSHRRGRPPLPVPQSLRSVTPHLTLGPPDARSRLPGSESRCSERQPQEAGESEMRSH